MKVLGILIDWQQNEYRKKHGAWGAVSYYRLVKPLESIGQKWIGKEIKKMSEGKNNEQHYSELVQPYDIIVTKHVDSAQAAASLAFMCKHFGKKLVVDLDDNLFEVRENQPAWGHGYRPGGQARAITAAFICEADALIVSTEPLKEYYTWYLKEVHKIEDKPIFVSPNYCDVKDFEFTPKDRDPNKVVIGWQGSTTHQDDLKIVIPALVKLMKKYKNVHVEFLGGIRPEDAAVLFENYPDKLLKRTKVTGGHPAWDKYPQLLASMPWDIGIAPIVDDDFNKGKSHIKWMEYSMYKIPTVASRVYPYYKDIGKLKTIQDGKTGYLAKSTAEWFRKLEELVLSEEKRKEIGSNAYNYIKENWQYSQNKNKIEEIYKQIYDL